MKLIVGLGNPGKEYTNTRHNVGFLVVDGYLEDSNWSSKFESLYCEKRINGEKVLFVKPQTYMNNSGMAVQKFVDYFDVEVEDILVIQDDLDLESLKYKLKRDSSAGGHNGIKLIISQLGTDAFLRLKIGISHSVNGNTVDHVLGGLSKSELFELENLQETFNAILESFVINGSEKTMNDYNKR